MREGSKNLEIIIAFSDIPIDVLRNMVSFLNPNDLKSIIFVSRIFRQITEEDFRYLSLYLQNRGTTKFHIEEFQKLQRGYHEPKFKVMLERVRTLNRVDLHLLSNAIRVPLDKMCFQTWELAVITGNVAFMLDSRHTMISSSDPFFHQEKRANYYSRVACLLGMLNMQAEFKKFPESIRCKRAVLGSYFYGLARKGHQHNIHADIETSSIKHDAKNSSYLNEHEQSVRKNARDKKLDYLMRASNLGRQHLPVSSLPLQYANDNHQPGTSYPHTSDFSYASLQACAFSSSSQSLIAMLELDSEFTKANIKTIHFILSVMLCDNISLFQYLIENRIISQNEVFYFKKSDTEILPGALDKLRAPLKPLKYIFLDWIHWQWVCETSRDADSSEAAYQITIIQIAAYMGSLAIIKYLLELGVAVNYNALLTGTPMCLALLTGHLSVANYLCQQGFSLKDTSTYCSKSSRTVLHYLLRNDIKEIKRHRDLYEYTKSLLSTDVQIIKHNKLVVCRMIDIKDNTRQTPFEVACDYRQVHTVMWLIKKKVCHNLIDNIFNMLVRLPISEVRSSPFGDGVLVEHGKKSIVNLIQTGTSLRDCDKYLTSFLLSERVRSFNSALSLFFEEGSEFEWRTYLLEFREETSYFFSNSLKYIINDFRRRFDAAIVFEYFFMSVFNELHLDAEFPRLNFIKLMVVLYEDIVTPLLSSFQDLYIRQFPEIIVSSLSDLYHLSYQLLQAQISAYSNERKGYFDHSYYHDSMLHFFADIYLSQGDEFWISIIKDLLTKAKIEQLTKISEKDVKKRDILCKLLDICGASVNPQESKLIDLINDLINKKGVMVDQKDTDGIDAAERILKLPRESAIYQNFKNNYSSNRTYFYRFFDSSSQQEPFEADAKRPKIAN